MDQQEAADQTGEMAKESDSPPVSQKTAITEATTSSTLLTSPPNTSMAPPPLPHLPLPLPSSVAHTTIHPSKPPSGSTSTSTPATPPPQPTNPQILRLQTQISILETQISTVSAQLAATTAQLARPDAAAATVKRHIGLLHRYNEIKDVGLGLMGLIADGRGERLQVVLEEMGMDVGD